MTDWNAVEAQSPMNAVVSDGLDTDVLPPAVKAALEDQTDLARERRYRNAAYAAGPWGVDRRVGLVARFLRRLSPARVSKPRSVRASSYYGDGLPNA